MLIKAWTWNDLYMVPFKSVETHNLRNLFIQPVTGMFSQSIIISHRVHIHYKERTITLAAGGCGSGQQTHWLLCSNKMTNDVDVQCLFVSVEHFIFLFNINKAAVKSSSTLNQFYWIFFCLVCWFLCDAFCLFQALVLRHWLFRESHVLWTQALCLLFVPHEYNSSAFPLELPSHAHWE